MNARTSLSQDNSRSLRPTYLKSGKTPVSRRNSTTNSVSNRRTDSPRRAQTAVWLEPSEQDRLLRQRSLSEARKGNFMDAIEGFNLLLKRNPSSSVDFNNRGLVYFQSGQFVAALADYNHAIQLNPKLASAYNNRANYYAAQSCLTEALADYEMAIDLDPTNIRAWINQGITFRELEEFAQAIENFDHALQITQLLSNGSTNVLEAHIFGARGRAHHLSGDWNYAIADYNRALERFADADTIDSAASHRLLAQIDGWLDDLIAPQTGF
ncbi:tetratricopeptide repeat protein [Phormidesmis priestleyi]